MLQHVGTDTLLIVENIISATHKIHNSLEEASPYRDVTARISITACRIRELLVAQYAQVEESTLLKISSDLEPIGIGLLANRETLQDLASRNHEEGEVTPSVDPKDLEPIAESIEKLLQLVLVGQTYKPIHDHTPDASDGEITAIAHAELRKSENQAVFHSLANKIVKLLETLKQDRQKALETIGMPQGTIILKQLVLREARTALGRADLLQIEKEIIELQVSLLEDQLATTTLRGSVLGLKPADRPNKESDVVSQPGKSACRNGARAMVYVINTATQLQEVSLSISASELNPTLRDLVLALDGLGLSEDARWVAEWRTGLFRSLAQKRPGRFQWVLASRLLYNATWLDKVGRQNDALASVKEAVETSRQLAKTCPLGFKPELANSLQALYSRFTSMGRDTDALSAIQESVTIRRGLIHRDSPLDDQLRLCTALELLFNTLKKLGRLNEAIYTIEEAVKICRPFSQSYPSKVDPFLSQLSARLSDHLRASSRNIEALDFGRESCQIYRKLYLQDPKVYGAPLSRALFNLSYFLNKTGHQKESLEAIQEAVEIYRQLAKDNPQQHEKDLPGALQNLSLLLTISHRSEEAVVSFQEAVVGFRKLVEDQPQLHGPNLARCLLGLSVAQGSSGRKNPAMESIEEAMALFRQITLDEHRELILKQLDAAVDVFKKLGWTDHYSCLLAERDYRTGERPNLEDKGSECTPFSLFGYIGSFFT